MEWSSSALRLASAEIFTDTKHLSLLTRVFVFMRATITDDATHCNHFFLLFYTRSHDR